MTNTPLGLREVLLVAQRYFHAAGTGAARAATEADADRAALKNFSGHFEAILRASTTVHRILAAQAVYEFAANEVGALIAIIDGKPPPEAEAMIPGITIRSHFDRIAFVVAQMNIRKLLADRESLFAASGNELATLGPEIDAQMQAALEAFMLAEATQRSAAYVVIAETLQEVLLLFAPTKK